MNYSCVVQSRTKPLSSQTPQMHCGWKQRKEALTHQGHKKGALLVQQPFLSSAQWERWEHGLVNADAEAYAVEG